MIDSEGYRPNVGIILCNQEGRLFWAKRIGQHSWQFPQGGIQRDESPEQAMFRELAEEVGLRPEHVQVVGSTRGWLRYRLPKNLIRQGNTPPCIGQKQVWFLLRMVGGEEAVRLDISEHPEFDLWQWVDYWYPLNAVVSFKRRVYWQALHELEPLVFYRHHTRSGSRLAKSSKSVFFTQNEDRSRPSAYPPSRAGTPAITVPAVSAARQAEPVRPAATARPAVVVPLRRVETHQHPVITRMVISVRHSSASEAGAVLPAGEQNPTVPLEDIRVPRPTVHNPHHWPRR